jgi:hypothetical protein
MRQVRCVVGGVVMAFTLAGCGESPPESGPVEFKATNSPEIDAFAKRMAENAKNKGLTKKPDAATKPSEAKPGETKPTTDAKAATKKE